MKTTTLDLSTLCGDSGRAKLTELNEYLQRAVAAVPAGAGVVLTGQAPVLLYLKIAHALHGRAKILYYESPVTGRVEIFNHNPE
jgi:hypothetical protein